MTARKKKPKIVVQPAQEWPPAPRDGWIRLIITGTPRTKKNDRVMGKAAKPLHLPSKAYMKWEREAEIRIPGVCLQPPWGFGYLREAEALLWTGRQIEPLLHQAMLPDRPLNCEALIYRHADVGDPVGFYQAIADLLEHKRVLANDRQIRQWDGTRCLVDRAQPRVELTLTALTLTLI